MFGPAKTALNASARSQQANTDGRFRPAMLTRNFLYLVAFDVMPFEDNAIVRLAITKNSLHIDSGHIHAWWRL